MHAFPRSQSALHGLGEIPFHVDGAHLDQPPRYVVLACAKPGDAPAATSIVRLIDVVLSPSYREQLDSTPFLVRNGRRSFYSTIASWRRSFVRFDLACMEPVSSDGIELIKVLSSALRECHRQNIIWQQGGIVIIDNWRALHGRSPRRGLVSPDRSLLRVYVQ